MVLYLVGIGLADEKDITLRGLEVVKGCKRVFLEAYTSILQVDTDKLEALYGRAVELADREKVESEADSIIADAKEGDVAFLVVGDPFGATTHTDLQIRAREEGVPVRVVHNASIMNAVAACGLQLYRFGQAVSIVFFTDTWRPESFYDRIVENHRLGLHTLCLLDIKVKEPTLESLARGKPQYEPPRYMTVAQALEQLLEVGEARGDGVVTPDSLCVGLARVGAEDEVIAAGPAKVLLHMDFGPPLHSLVLAGQCHPLEEQALATFLLPADQQPSTGS